MFFRFSVLVICGILVWSDSVRTAATVVIMYRFTAVPCALYNGTILRMCMVLFTAVGRQMSGFEPSLPCFCAFCFCFFSFFSWVGEWVSGCLSTVLFTAAAVGLQMSGLEPSPLRFCALFSSWFPFFLFWWLRGVYYCCCVYHSIPKYICFRLFKLLPNNVPSFWPLTLTRDSPEKSRLPPSNVKDFVAGNS